MQSNRQLCEETVARITELVPPAELRYAFIAGSRAVGDPRSDSDVDYVVVLNRPSRSHEVAVAQAMRDIHRAHALQYSHCGEILSRPTLENMLSASPQLRNLVEIGFLECACFGADCILSIARKFLVVLHMLSGPKCDIVGDTDALADDAARAGQFFASVPGFHFPKSPQVLDWSGAPADSPRSARWRQVMDQVQAGNHLDTPV
nr:nucleotidyltransferase domain-containing protein [Hyphomonas sp.]